MPPETEPVFVGIPQSAKTYYFKASNGNVSIMRLATQLNWAEYALKCNKCQEEHFLKDGMVLATAIHPEIDEFCAKHQHKDWVSYAFHPKSQTPFVSGKTETVTISKEEFERLKKGIGQLPKPAVEEEGRVFRKEDE